MATGEEGGHRRASVDSLVDEEEEDHIRVLCRIRPHSAREGGRSALGPRSCVTVDDEGKTVSLKASGGPKAFTFDHSVGPEGGQEVLFKLAGKPVTKSCLQGYNGTIFCYGQTGSGKTFTMFGPHLDCDSCDEQRGLVPRVLEYLFAQMAREEKRSNGQVKHLCRCSFYEIFNERVFDLLDAGCSTGGLQVREDMKKGVFVEGLTEEALESSHQANEILSRGYRNRHVGETAMNRESSRSHAVFSLVIESKEIQTVNGITKSRCSSFNLVDLAGSERQSATGATGERLKEAGQINKSLSALGNVINALVEASAGKTRYIHYRDSKLTFLLRDSLGGNAKTFLVATISPADENFAETLSTLKFAQRAKMIKNKAVVNEDTSGTVEALQKQLRLLRQELLTARAMISVSEPGQAMPNDTSLLGRSDHVAVNEKTEALLRDALDRSLRIERAREAAEERANKTQQVVARLEQAVMHEQMMRKMKEKQLKRAMEKKLAGAGKENAENDAEADFREEVEALRKELELAPVESVKWRVAYEGAQEELAALTQGKSLAEWVAGDMEVNHVRNLQEELKASLESKAQLQERVDELVLQAETKPCPVRRMSDGTMQRLREAEGRVADLEAQLAASTKAAQEAEARVAESKAKAAQAVSAQAQLQCQITALERKLEGEYMAMRKDKEAEMQALQDRIVDLQAQQQDQSDVEQRLAAVCKDNTVLLARLRETAAEADDSGAQLREAQDQIQKLQQELSQEAIKATEAEEALKEMEARMTQERQQWSLKESTLMDRLQQSVDKSVATEEALSKEIEALKASHDEVSARLGGLAAQKDDVDFQLANLQEDHDTLQELLEFTQDKNKELEGALVQAQDEVAHVCKERDQAKLAAQALQDKLDKMGGDFADGRQQLQDLESSFEELKEENSQLLSSLEAARAEEESSRERLEVSEREVKEVGRVVAELTEEVGRLRQELAATKAEASSLTEERADVVARLREAEEVVSSLREENQEYCNETQALKAEAANRIRAHEEEVSQQEGAHKMAMEEMRARVASLEAQVEELEGEVASEHEALCRHKEEGEEYKRMLQEVQDNANEASECLSHKYIEMEAALEARKKEVADMKAKVAQLEKSHQEAVWRHTEELAEARSALADAEARAAEVASLRSQCTSLQEEVGGLQAQVQELEVQAQQDREHRRVAEDKCQALASQVGEALSSGRDVSEEKARLEAELLHARQVVREMAEQQRQRKEEELQELEREVSELKAANVRLIGHANSRQKIQLHRKLKEELDAQTKRCKALEQENFTLHNELKLKSTSLPPSKDRGHSQAHSGVVLGNLTNTLN